MAGHRGDEPGARAALVDPDSAVRATALGALGRMGALRSDDVDVALADADPSVRRRAAEEAGAHPGLAVDLVPVLSDDDSAVVEAACWALGERGDEAGDAAVAALV